MAGEGPVTQPVTRARRAAAAEEPVIGQCIAIIEAALEICEDVSYFVRGCHTAAADRSSR